MKLSLLALFLAAPVLAGEPPKAAAPAAPKAAAAKTETKAKDAFKTDDERRAYTVGYLMGRNISPFALSASEIKAAQQGLSDAANAKAPGVDVRFYQPSINDMLAARMGKAAETEKAKGKAFAEKWVKENKPKDIPGGGWYLETAAGTGAIPGKTDTVKVHYRGTTVDGVEFDSSYSRGEPTQFALNGVIACWTNGISMMKAGGKAKLLCPSDVAYGDPGRSGIKPGATLLFEAELVEVVKAEEPAKKK
ncbi:MAG: FKBP-type peptidyl-prolyl cis-trans isomerase [Elusimicrobiota bacterium]|nr:MAG: FKBP-type peptidyl-prolyl cis-trans isomerase [Elusimicrobiota bacterium]